MPTGCCCPRMRRRSSALRTGDANAQRTPQKGGFKACSSYPKHAREIPLILASREQSISRRARAASARNPRGLASRKPQARVVELGQALDVERRALLAQVAHVLEHGRM